LGFFFTNLVVKSTFSSGEITPREDTINTIPLADGIGL
jgi:hypothetical protein